MDPSTEKQKRQEQQQRNAWVRYSGLAFQFLATIGIGVLIGMKLDDWLQLTFPWFLITFVLLANGLAIFWLIRSLPKDQ